MNHTVAVALVMCAPLGRWLGAVTSAGVAAQLGIRRKNLPLDLFQFLARAGHVSNSE
jgi:hypothetical protein